MLIQPLDKPSELCEISAFEASSSFDTKTPAYSHPQHGIPEVILNV